ncbi:MAG TPA: PQQ-binding-like beta-propeller repeat protein [Planctomycetaceae bacterium]|nr:PQQ-binding-like beta-propeller repeat protein [Planctomycetaceae bacterium]
MRWLRSLLVAVVASAGVTIHAQDQHPSQRRFRESIALETSAVVVKKLASVGEYLADGQIDEAVEILRDISAASGDTLVPVEPGRYVNASHYGHLLVAGLPPEALAAYRQRVDGWARQWFEEGRSRRDEALLRRVVAQAFTSSFGDDALWLLGEWAWDRGELSSARAYWTQMLPLPLDQPVAPGRPLPVLRYPDAGRSQAEILARLVLVSIVEGDRERATDELAVFRTRHAASEGELAGRHGRLAEILEAVLGEARTWQVPVSVAQYQTFAANPRRNGAVPQSGLDVGHVLWSDTLPPERWMTENPRPALRPDPPLRLFPVVSGDMLLASDGQRVYHWKLRAAEPTPVWPAGERGAVLFPDVPGAASGGYMSSRVIGVPRHTLTVHNDRLYAKLGSPIAGRAADEVHQFPSSLVCLDLSPEKQGKRVWEVASDELLPDEPGWLFEGSPVADSGRVYVALRRNHPDARLRIACLEAESGRPIWNRHVGSSVFEVGDKHNLMSHQLLTLGENAVFYSTDMGAIVALDVRDGRPLWVVTYESQKPADVELLNDHLRNGLTPCLYHRGLVVAAPNDFGGVLAIDAETGLVRWEQRPFPDRIRHLLGVGRGKVIVSGNSLWGLDLWTGRFRPPDGWGEPAEQNPQMWGYGQGLLLGDEVLFPKRDEIDVRDQATGRRNRLIRLKEHDRAATGGNLAVAGRHLIVAEPNRIVVFSDTSGLLDQQRDVVEAHPRSVRARFDLAETQALAGQLEEALEQFRIAASLPAAGDADGPVQQQARQRMFELLVRLGGRAAETGDLPQATSRLATAIDTAPDRGSQLAATWRLAEVQAAHGRPEHAVATYQSIVQNVELAALPDPAPSSRTAGQAARREIDRLIELHGRSVYRRFDEDARRRFAAALSAGDPQAVRALVEAFPNARDGPAALLELARLHRRRGEPRDSIRICRRLLAALPTADLARDDGGLPAQAKPPTSQQADTVRRDAIELLARACEEGAYWRLAARAWRQLAAEFPRAVVESDEVSVVSPAAVNVSAVEFAARRLASPPYTAELPPPGASAPPLPLERLWSRRLPPGAEVVLPSGEPPANGLRCVLFNDTGLHAIDPADGRDRWERRIDHPVLWAAYAGEQLLIGTRRTLRALSLERGDVLWERPLSAAGSSEESDRRPRGLPSFTALEDQTVCLIPGRRLFAVDLEGGLRWEFARTGATLGPRWLCDGRHTVVQTFVPDRTVIIDSASGETLAEWPGDPDPWLREPVRLSHVRFVTIDGNRRIHVVSADPQDPGWTYAGPASHANADPDALPAGDRLLVVIDGDTLLSLDLQTGERQWSRPLARNPLQAAAGRLASDGESLYWATDGILRRVALADGSLMWERLLGSPAGAWQAACFDHYVAAWPAGRTHKSSHGEALLICDAATGDPVQELMLPAASELPGTRVRLHIDWPTCVASAGGTLIGLGARPRNVTR